MQLSVNMPYDGNTPVVERDCFETNLGGGLEGLIMVVLVPPLDGDNITRWVLVNLKMGRRCTKTWVGSVSPTRDDVRLALRGMAKYVGRLEVTL